MVKCFWLVLGWKFHSEAALKSQKLQEVQTPQKLATTFWHKKHWPILSPPGPQHAAAHMVESSSWRLPVGGASRSLFDTYQRKDCVLPGQQTAKSVGPRRDKNDKNHFHFNRLERPIREHQQLNSILPGFAKLRGANDKSHNWLPSDICLLALKCMAFDKSWDDHSCPAKPWLDCGSHYQQALWIAAGTFVGASTPDTETFMMVTDNPLANPLVRPNKYPKMMFTCLLIPQ